MNAQTDALRKRINDSLQVLINKAKNDTAIIYYEAQKADLSVLSDPLSTYKRGRDLYEKAKKLDHPSSVWRSFTVIYKALDKMAQTENNIPKKEKLLARCDSVLKETQTYILENFKDLTLLDYYTQTSSFYRIMARNSVTKREFYFDKELEGFQLLVDKYNFKKYPDLFLSQYFGLAVEYQNRLITNKAASIYIMLAEYADSMKRYDRATEYYNNLGFTYFADGNFTAAQRYYFLSLKVTEKLPADSFTVSERHKDRIANKGVTMANIANVFFLQKNYQQSIDYYRRALPYYLDGGATEIYISVILRIGTIYATINQLDSATAYLQKEKKLGYLLKDKNALIAHEIRINSLQGLIFAQKKRYKDAILIAQNVVRLSEQLNNPNAKMTAYESIGSYYVLNNEPLKAVEFFNKQLAIGNQVGWKAKTLSKIYINKGKAFIKANKADSAIANLLSAKAIAEKVNVKLEMNLVYQNLAEAYILKNNMSEAVFYLKKHIQYKDSLVGDQVTQQVTSMALNYESDKKLMAEQAMREKLRLESEKKSEEEAQKRKVLLIIILSISVLVIIAAYSLFRIKKANIMLELQKKEIEKQKNRVEHQKTLVEVKNKEILDSINYAKRIQKAFINTESYITENTREHFIFFKPKDIVSGDFYWAAKHHDHVYIAACDCTGHGVPGAFMSLLSISFLNEAVNQRHLVNPNEVFNFVKKNFIYNLSFEESKDGMDACLIHIDKSTKKITYAAANNKPLIVRNGELIELPCDKMPVGESIRREDFHLYHVDYKEDDILYMYTDGYKDQFGSSTNKKLNSKLFKKLLQDLSPLSLQLQKEKLTNFFEEWKGNIEQTDDVCIIGLKL